MTDRRVFDGTMAGVIDLIGWMGPRVPYTLRDSGPLSPAGAKGDNLSAIGVQVKPDWPVIEKVYPGDTIILGDNGVLTFEHVSVT